MARGTWWAIVHRMTKSWTQLKRLSTHTRTASQTSEDEMKPHVSVCDKPPTHDLCWWIRMTVCV